jgi:hypothetical protein
MSTKSGRTVDAPQSISDVVKNSNFTFNFRHADKLVKSWELNPVRKRSLVRSDGNKEYRNNSSLTPLVST